jgi:hypothetical protein
MSKIKNQKSKMKIVELPRSGNDFLNFAFCTLIFAFLFAGCGRLLEPKAEPPGMRSENSDGADVLARGPDAEAISVPSDEAARTIKATGGLNVWKKTAKLQLDCVVTFYQPDGTFYLTEQCYEVHPWSNSIRISADEPQGTFVWQLSEGQFDVLKGAGQIDALPDAVPSRCFAEVILNIITAPVRFLDGSVEFSEQPNPVKMQGKWYYPINRQSRDVTARLSGAVFYRDRDSSLVDMIRLACLNTGAAREKSVQYVRGYDYQKVEKAGPLVPTRIEIFETDARDRTQKRLVKIDCHTLKRTQ